MVNCQWLMFNGYVPQSLQATVADARHQVAFLCPRHKHRLPAKQTFEDVAADILALLHVEQQGSRHPLHLVVVLHEQSFYSLPFHHVFTYNTLQTKKKLTQLAFFLRNFNLPVVFAAQRYCILV